MLRIELLIDARAELGEGPLWDVAEQRLYWIDSLRRQGPFLRRRRGAARTWDVPEHIGSLALRERGGAVVSLRDGFYVLDFVSGAVASSPIPTPASPACA